MSDRVSEIWANAAKFSEEHPEMATLPEPVWDNELIPDVDDLGAGPVEDDGLSGFLDNWSVLDAYRRYCGKMEPKVGSRRESIMVSCPRPGHQDDDPSAWLNLDKDTWFCGGCQEGGDKYDIAAWGLGKPVPNYKEKFGELRKQIAQDHGHAVITVGTTERILPPADEAPEQDEPAEVIQLDPHALGPDEDERSTPELDLDLILMSSRGSFLDTWVREHRDVAPDTMNFWAGLVGLSMAAGRNTFVDGHRPTRGNLFVVLVAPSGSGKSSAIGPITGLIQECFFYDAQEPNEINIDIIKGAASGEALVNMLDAEIEGPPGSNGLPVMEKIPKRGLAIYDEFATLAKKAAIQGSSLREILQELADGGDLVTYSTKAHTGRAERPHMSLLSGTQPGVIRNYIDRSDIFSGFANRFYFIRDNTIWQPRGFRAGHRPNTLLAAQKIKDIHIKYEAHPFLVANGAIQNWDERVLEYHEVSREHGATNPLMMRMDLKFMQVAMHLAINDMANEIDHTHIDRAAIVMDWLVECTIGTGEDISSGRVNDTTDGIIKAIRWATGAKHSRKASFKAISGRMNRGGGDFQDDEILRGLDLLAKVGVLGRIEDAKVIHWVVLDESEATTWVEK